MRNLIYYTSQWLSISMIKFDCLMFLNKDKAVPLQAWGGPKGSKKLMFPDFLTTAQDDGKVVSPKHRPYLPQEILSVLISVRGWVNEKFHDTIWDRTSDFLICSAVQCFLIKYILLTWDLHTYYETRGYRSVWLKMQHFWNVRLWRWASRVHKCYSRR
jgi:hypothetical protein